MTVGFDLTDHLCPLSLGALRDHRQEVKPYLSTMLSTVRHVMVTDRPKIR